MHPSVTLTLPFSPEAEKAACAWLDLHKVPISRTTPATNIQLAIRHGWVDWTVEKGIIQPL